MRGFTLLELLVVIAVVAVTAIFIIPNLGKSTDDQKLKNVVEELQTVIRQAQNNAQSGVLCGGSKAQLWRIEFAKGAPGSQDSYKILCNNGSSFGGDKNYPIPSGFLVEAIKVYCPSEQSITPTTGTFRPFVNFANISGRSSFGCNEVSGSSRTTCSLSFCGYDDGGTSPTLLFITAQKMIATVKSQKTNSTKAVVVEKGGAVYVQ